MIDASPDLRRRALRIRREIEGASTVVLSVPKAGRSWVNYFLARYVAELTGRPLELNLVEDGPDLPTVRFVHEHLDVFQDAPAPVRLLNEDLLLRRRIVVLVRDPRDALVSYWHHKRVREARPVAAALDAFAESPVYGIERLSRATAVLLDLHGRHSGDRLLVRYEDLRADPARRLREVLLFTLDGRPVDEQAWRGALAASRFDRMRDWERALTPEEARRLYADRFGPRRGGALADSHFKVRRGEVGGFRTEMSAQLQARVAGLPHTAAVLERLGVPAG